MSRWMRFTFLAGISLLLAACQVAPRLIGAYPKSPSTRPPAQPLSQPVTVIYDATLELEVPSVDRAARQAEGLASHYGGYLVDSASWTTSGQVSTRLTLAVPSASFDAMHMALLDLGRLVGEQLSSRVTWSDYRPVSGYSYVTVTLRASSYEWPQPRQTGWNPLVTFSQALYVSAAIFGFVVNALIWIAVVAGPFVLLGLALRALLSRRRS